MPTTRPTIGPNRADGYVVTGLDWDNDVVAQGLWAQEVIAGTNADKIPAAAIAGVVGAYPNLVVNGGAEINQRAAGAVTLTATPQVSTDRWQAGLTAPLGTATAQQSAGIGVGSQFSQSIVYTHGGGNGYLSHKVENFAECRGRRVYLSAQVSTAAGSPGGFLQLNDGVGANNSGAIVTGLQTVTLFLDVNTAATQLSVTLFVTASGTYFLDNVMLCIAPAAIAYVPRPYAEEVALCKRYYQKIKLSSRWRAVLAGEFHDTTVFYQQAMPGVPTAVRTAGTLANISAASVLDLTSDGARVEYTATAGTATTGTDTQALSETISLEYNP